MYLVKTETKPCLQARFSTIKFRRFRRSLFMYFSVEKDSSKGDSANGDSPLSRYLVNTSSRTFKT